jgi:PAS domain S-box-containing protein
VLVEDSAPDARLILQELGRAGFEPVATRVETEAEFVARLRAETDVIVCDFALPQFDALRALALARARDPDVPFLIVSGAFGEDAVVEAIKSGATDCLLKDRLGRLGPAVRRALAERDARAAQRRDQDALRASEGRYRALADSIPQIVWTARPDGTLDYLNRQALEYFGAGTDRPTGRAWEGLAHPDDLPGAPLVRDPLRTDEPSAFELRLRRADGAYRWHICRQVAIRDAGGAVVQWFGSCTDIHDQKAVADRLARDARLLAAVRDAVIVTDWDGVVTYWNDGAARLFGWDAGEMVGRPYADSDPDATRTRVVAAVRDRSDGHGWAGEYQTARKDGARIWVDARVGPITDAANRPVGVMEVCHDITARKRAEGELERQRRELQLIFDAVPALIYYKDREHRLVRVNREFVRLVGLPPGSIAGRTDADLGSPHADRYARDEDEVIATGRAKRGVLEPLATPDGVRWLRTDKLPHRDESGRIVGVIGFALDVTERHQAEASLDAVMRSVADAVITLDERGTIDAANPAVRTVLGYAEAELIGRHLGLIIDDPERAPHGPGEGGPDVARLIGIGREVTGRRKDGTAFPADLSVSEFHLDGTRRFTAVVRDITARKQLEAQFLQAQKMDAFGQLAAGVAHDFNNLLTVINGYSALLLRQFPAPDDRRDDLVEIRTAGERAAALTAQLLAFSRKSIVEPKVLDLNAVVASMANLLRRLIGEDVALVTTLAPGLGRVRADPGQLEQVIMNLAVNARDAMPRGGRLTIETANEARAEAGRYARLSVTDTGTGMTDEVRARLFEPFFTTKSPGQGTGLGLATVYGIVTQAQGRLEVATAPGRGTTFTVLLPAVPDPVTGAGGSEPDHVSGTGTVLLVEDEEPVRKLARIILEARGYEVLEAETGADAVRAAGTHPGPIHLLITDVVMPGMGGREVADAVRRLRPEVRILYVSGYTDDALVRHGVTGEEGAFLQKPFTPHGLAQKVRALLNGTGRNG